MLAGCFPAAQLVGIECSLHDWMRSPKVRGTRDSSFAGPLVSRQDDSPHREQARSSPGACPGPPNPLRPSRCWRRHHQPCGQPPSAVPARIPKFLLPRADPLGFFSAPAGEAKSLRVLPEPAFTFENGIHPQVFRLTMPFIPADRMPKPSESLEVTSGPTESLRGLSAECD